MLTRRQPAVDLRNAAVRCFEESVRQPRHPRHKRLVRARKSRSQAKMQQGRKARSAQQAVAIAATAAPASEMPSAVQRNGGSEASAQYRYANSRTSEWFEKEEEGGGVVCSVVVYQTGR